MNKKTGVSFLGIFAKSFPMETALVFHERARSHNNKNKWKLKRSNRQKNGLWKMILLKLCVSCCHHQRQTGSEFLNLYIFWSSAEALSPLQQFKWKQANICFVESMIQLLQFIFFPFTSRHGKLSCVKWRLIGMDDRLTLNRALSTREMKRKSKKWVRKVRMCA